MNAEHAEILARINKYAEKVLADIDPQKTPVSSQLEALKPILTEIAKEKNMALEDMFILYMDLASEAAITRENEFQASINEDTLNSFSNIANRLQ